ncbi:MAG: hypothetical protein AAF602_31610 [Myxococcota bacterium]
MIVALRVPGTPEDEPGGWIEDVRRLGLERPCEAIRRRTLAFREALDHRRQGPRPDLGALSRHALDDYAAFVAWILGRYPRRSDAADRRRLLAPLDAQEAEHRAYRRRRRAR